MDRPLVLVIEDAKSVLMSTVITIKNQTGLPSTILDGILSEFLRMYVRTPVAKSPWRPRRKRRRRKKVNKC